jgi:hypothetical protein
MTETNKPEEVCKIACEVCLREVPTSEAKRAETQDYVVHFCGLECYEKWVQKQEKQTPQND